MATTLSTDECGPHEIIALHASRSNEDAFAAIAVSRSSIHTLTVSLTAAEPSAFTSPGMGRHRATLSSLRCTGTADAGGSLLCAATGVLSDTPIIVTCSAGTPLRILSVIDASLRELGACKHSTASHLPSCASVDTVNDRVALGTACGGVSVAHLGDLTTVWRSGDGCSAGPAVHDVAWWRSQTHTVLAAGGGFVALLDTRDAACTPWRFSSRVATADGSTPLCIATSVDEPWVVMCGTDSGRLAAWDMRRPSEELKSDRGATPQNGGPVWDAAFVSGVGVVVTGADDGGLRAQKVAPFDTLAATGTAWDVEAPTEIVRAAVGVTSVTATMPGLVMCGTYDGHVYASTALWR